MEQFGGHFESDALVAVDALLDGLGEQEPAPEPPSAPALHPGLQSLQRWAQRMNATNIAFKAVTDDPKTRSVEVGGSSMILWTEPLGANKTSTTVKYIHWGDTCTGRILTVESGRMKYCNHDKRKDMTEHMNNGNLIMLIPNVRTSMVRTKRVALMSQVPDYFVVLERFFRALLDLRIADTCAICKHCSTSEDERAYRCPLCQLAFHDSCFASMCPICNDEENAENDAHKEEEEEDLPSALLGAVQEQCGHGRAELFTILRPFRAQLSPHIDLFCAPCCSVMRACFSM